MYKCVANAITIASYNYLYSHLFRPILSHQLSGGNLRVTVPALPLSSNSLHITRLPPLAHASVQDQLTHIFAPATSAPLLEVDTRVCLVSATDVHCARVVDRLRQNVFMVRD